jgi:Domain of unknown function (DUF5679)
MARAMVEDCWAVDVLELGQSGYLFGETEGFAMCRQEGRHPMGIEWQVVRDEVGLLYPIPGPEGTWTDREDWVSIVRTPSEVGGERVWFVCPRCYRKVRKLYLSPQGEHFRCRLCHDLSYRSKTRLSPWPQREKLRKELDALPIGSRRYTKTLLQMQKYDEAFRRRCFRALLIPWALPSDVPTRHPGRPSKKELREEAKAAREAARAMVVKRPRGRPKKKRAYTRRSPLVLSERKSDMEAYCVKCRDRRELKDPQPLTLSNGRPAIQGTCPVCATKLTRIVKAGEKSLQS